MVYHGLVVRLLREDVCCRRRRPVHRMHLEDRRLGSPRRKAIPVHQLELAGRGGQHLLVGVLVRVEHESEMRAAVDDPDGQGRRLQLVSEGQRRPSLGSLVLGILQRAQHPDGQRVSAALVPAGLRAADGRVRAHVPIRMPSHHQCQELRGAQRVRGYDERRLAARSAGIRVHVVDAAGRDARVHDQKQSAGGLEGRQKLGHRLLGVGPDGMHAAHDVQALSALRSAPGEERHGARVGRGHGLEDRHQRHREVRVPRLILRAPARLEAALRDQDGVDHRQHAAGAIGRLQEAHARERHLGLLEKRQRLDLPGPSRLGSAPDHLVPGRQTAAAQRGHGIRPRLLEAGLCSAELTHHWLLRLCAGVEEQRDGRLQVAIRGG
eukprot:scaffold576_cov260-Pinguiococcus_pyrenoidosus.AAC.59